MADDKVKPIYSVVVGKHRLSCINTSTGSTVGTLSYDGTVSSGPIVTGDRCVTVFKTPTGLRGRIMKLPNFTTITTFSV